MKKLLFLPLFAALALLAACSDDDDNITPPAPEQHVTSVDYYGVLAVGEFTDTVRCTVVYNNAAKVADITVCGMRFSDKMPAVDMRMAGIICSATSTDIVFAPSATVIPEVSVSAAPGAPSQPGVSNSQYAMTGLAGAIKDKTMEFSAAMPMGEVSFHGTVVPLFTGSMNVLATGEEKPFTMDDVLCEVELEDGGALANLFIYGAKFAEGMPVKVDIKLPGVSCRHFNDGYSIAVSDSLVPLVRMGAADFVPMPAFTFTKVSGEVRDAGLLYFDASMTRGVFSYEGERFIKIIKSGL